MKKDCVDYLELIARAAEEDKAEYGGETVLPEPAGEQVVDYLAVSERWKEGKARMVNERE